MKTHLILILFFTVFHSICFGQLYDYYVARSLQYLGDGDTERAAFYANKAIDKDSTQSRGYYLLGSAYSDEGKFEQALTVLEKSESMEDAEIQVYYMLGHVHDRLAHFQRSYEYFGKYAEEDSSDLFVLTRKAHLACKIKKYDEARNILDHVLSIEPQRIQALNIYGLYHESREEYNEAIEYFSRIIDLDQANATAYYNRCRNHAFLENEEENCSDCKTAIALGIPDGEFFLLDESACD